MYKLFRHGSRFNKKLFASYEEARSYIRKWIRKNHATGTRLNFMDSSKSELLYYNPAISAYGFTISKT